MKIFSLALFTISIISTSCTKHNAIPTVANPSKPKLTRSLSYDEVYNDLKPKFEADGVDINNVTVSYFLDNLEVSSIDHLADYSIVYSSSRDLATRSAEIHVRAFSSIEAYYQYGKIIGKPFREIDEFGKHMENYAIKHNLLDVENVEQEHIDYENQLFKQYFKKTRAVVNYWDDFVQSGPNHLIPLATYPNVINSWKNRFGGCSGFAITWVGKFYDKTYYRSGFGVFANWGLTFIPFHSSFGTGDLNNRIESGIQL